jgi:hypothetical protein
MINENLLKELEGLDLVKILRILTAYAGLKTYGKNLPSGKIPKEYAQESFYKFLIGERKWNKKANPNIVDFLKGEIDSFISNDIRSKKRQKTLNIVDNPDFDIQNTYPSKDLTYEEFLESEQETEELKKEIQEAIKGDDNLELYFISLEENYNPKQFSELFNIEINEVYNMVRKLKRITQKFLKNRKITQK